MISNYADQQKMTATATARSLPKLNRYPDKAMTPKNVESLSQSVGYLKNSITVLVRCQHPASDQLPVSTVLDKVDKFIGTIADTLKQQEEKVENLEEEIQLLKKEIAELQHNLLVGQVAFKLEQEIIKLLLDGTELYEDAMLTLHQLSRAVSPDPDCISRILLGANDSQIAKINKNWDDFEKRLEPTIPKQLYRAIEQYSSEDDYPNIPLNAARERLSKANLKERKSVELMLRTLESLNVVHIGTELEN